MSELKALLAEHCRQIATLRRKCKHLKKHLRIRRDSSVVGRGSVYPSVHVVCRNCGKKKVMYIGSAAESKVMVKLTLNRQEGIEDQRLDCSILHEYELD